MDIVILDVFKGQMDVNKNIKLTIITNYINLYNVKYIIYHIISVLIDLYIIKPMMCSVYLHHITVLSFSIYNPIVYLYSLCTHSYI